MFLECLWDSCAFLLTLSCHEEAHSDTLNMTTNPCAMYAIHPNMGMHNSSCAPVLVHGAGQEFVCNFLTWWRISLFFFGGGVARALGEPAISFPHSTPNNQKGKLTHKCKSSLLESGKQKPTRKQPRENTATCTNK